MNNIKVKDLRERATLVKVKCTKWAGTIKDFEVQKEIAEKYGVDPEGAGTYTKTLVAKRLLKDIHTASQHLRDAYKVHTMPWDEKGWRLLPMSAYSKCMEEIEDAKEEFFRARDALLALYEEAKEDARNSSLKGMFKESDYPSLQELEGMYTVEVRFDTLRDADDIRVKASKEVLDAVRNSVEKQVNQQLQEAVEEPARRCLQVVGHLAESLKAYGDETGKGGKRNIYINTLEHVKKLGTALADLNVTGDPSLQKAAYLIQTDIMPVEMDDLKSDAAVRENTAQKAQEVADLAATFLSGMKP